MRSTDVLATASFACALIKSAPASAQTVGVTIEIDQPILAPGESTTVRLVASFPDVDYAVAGILMDLAFDSPIADPRRHWSNLELLPPFESPPVAPIVTDSAIEGLLGGQLNFPPAMIYADPTNPIAFYEATFTAPLDAGRFYEVDLLTDVSRFDVYIDRGSAESQSRLDLLVEGEATISVVPAPTSAAVVILGFAALRRRRPHIE